MAKSSTRVVVWTAIVVALVLGMLFGYKGWQGHRAQAAQAHHGPYAATVSAAPVQSVSWQRAIHAVANLVAVQGVHLTPQLSGQVTGIYFHSGQFVHKGDRLVQLDDSNQRAQLASDLAAQALAKASYERAERLYATHAASEADLQSTQAAYRSAQAAVADVQATLAKLSVSAPFSGWLGVRAVSLGQYLTPGTEIAALNVWDPLRLQFAVPQGEIGLLHVGQTVQLGVNAFPGQTFTGQVSALGSEIDPGSRSFTVQASLPNPRHLLRPGMFGEARLLVGEARKVLTVPSVAISYNTFGDYVYVIGSRRAGGQSMQVAVATPVQTGETRGGLTEVTRGLEPGARVVTAGQLKLHDGMPVSVPGAAAH